MAIRSADSRKICTELLEENLYTRGLLKKALTAQVGCAMMLLLEPDESLMVAAVGIKDIGVTMYEKNIEEIRDKSLLL